MNYATRIITTCGGVRVLARALGRSSSTVSSWRVRGSIPDDAKAQILTYARAAGLPLEPADFFPVELLPAPVEAAE